MKDPYSEKQIPNSSVLPTSNTTDVCEKTLDNVDQNNLKIPCENKISHTSVSATSNTTDVYEETSEICDQSILKDPPCVNKITHRSVLPTSTTTDICEEKSDHMDVDCITNDCEMNVDHIHYKKYQQKNTAMTLKRDSETIKSIENMMQ